MKKFDISKDKILRMYIDENKSTHDIANLLNVNRKTISNRLKEKVG